MDRCLEVGLDAAAEARLVGVCRGATGMDRYGSKGEVGLVCSGMAAKSRLGESWEALRGVVWQQRLGSNGSADVGELRRGSCGAERWGKSVSGIPWSGRKCRVVRVQFWDGMAAKAGCGSDVRGTAGTVTAAKAGRGFAGPGLRGWVRPGKAGFTS
jgi:hypothetical protein